MRALFPSAATWLVAAVVALAVCPLALGQGVPGGPDPIPQAPDPVPQAPAPTPAPTPAPRPSAPAPTPTPTPQTPPVVEPSGPSPAEIQAQKEAEAKARAAERKRRAEALARRRAEERKRKAAEKRQKELSGLTTFSNTLTKASERVGKVRIDVPAVTGTSSRSSAGGVGNTIPLLLVLASLVCAALALLPSMVARRDPRLSSSGGLVVVASHRLELTAVAASCLLIALFILGLN